MVCVFVGHSSHCNLPNVLVYYVYVYYIPAKKEKKKEETRFFEENEHTHRTKGFKTKKEKGEGAIDCLNAKCNASSFIMALPRTNRLSASEIRRKKIFHARRTHTRIGTIFVKEESGPNPRFAFVVSSKVSKKAVERNKIRRRAAEWVRKRRMDMRVDVFVFVVFKKEAGEFSKKEFYDALEESFRKAGILKDSLT